MEAKCKKIKNISLINNIYQSSYRIEESINRQDETIIIN